MMAQNKALLDETTMTQLMGYLKIDDHDLFASYVKRLGIDHND
jgi:hypothetical protein